MSHQFNKELNVLTQVSVFELFVGNLFLCQGEVESKLFWKDGEDESEIEEENVVTATPSTEGPTYGYPKLHMMPIFPKKVQCAWIGTAEFYRSSQASLEKIVDYFKDLRLEDALHYH